LGDYGCMAKGNYYIFAEKAEELNKTLSECEEELKKYQVGVQDNILKAYAAKVNGNYDQALEYILDAQATSKIAEGTFDIIGELYLLKKDYTNAKFFFEKRVQVDPFNPDILYQLALTHAGMKEMKEAKEYLQRALDIWKNADENYIPMKKAKAKMKNWG